jgi:hypothetical protein
MADALTTPQDNFNDAVTTLDLTPQEQFLYQHGLNNLNNGTWVQQPTGEVSTILQTSVEGPDGKTYNIPTVWDGKVLSVDQAMARAAAVGWDKWPSYDNPDAAEKRYQSMHTFMDRDQYGTPPVKKPSDPPPPTIALPDLNVQAQPLQAVPGIQAGPGGYLRGGLLDNILSLLSSIGGGQQQQSSMGQFLPLTSDQVPRWNHLSAQEPSYLEGQVIPDPKMQTPQIRGLWSKEMEAAGGLNTHEREQPTVDAIQRARRQQTWPRDT